LGNRLPDYFISVPESTPTSATTPNSFLLSHSNLRHSNLSHSNLSHSNRVRPHPLFP